MVGVGVGRIVGVGTEPGDQSSPACPADLPGYPAAGPIGPDEKTSTELNLDPITDRGDDNRPGGGLGPKLADEPEAFESCLLDVQLRADR